MMRSITSPKKPRSRLIRLLRGCGIAVFWLGLWQLLALVIAQEELLLPGPLTVARTLGTLAATETFWRVCFLSLLRIFLGFAAAMAVGCLLAVATVRFSLLHHLFSPLLKLIRAAPVASFILLALVWLKTDILPAFISFLMVVPLVFANVESGLRQVDIDLLEVAKVYDLGPLKTLTQVWLPSLMPYLLSAGTTGLGFAFKSGIAAEVICRPKASIGGELYLAKLYLETPEVFAWTAAVILLSVLLEKGLLWAIRGIRRRPLFAAREVT